MSELRSRFARLKMPPVADARSAIAVNLSRNIQIITSASYTIKRLWLEASKGRGNLKAWSGLRRSASSPADACAPHFETLVTLGKLYSGTQRKAGDKERLRGEELDSTE